MPQRLIKVFAERNTGTNLFRQILVRNSSAILWPGTLSELGSQHETDVNAAIAACSPCDDKVHVREHHIDEIFEREFDRCLGWKHGAPAFDRISRNPQFANTLFVVIVKNPYAWLLSMYRRPYHNLLTDNTHSFRVFWRSRWLTVRRDNAPRVFDNPVALWNYKYREYMAFAQRAPVRFLRYEDILHRPEVVLTTCEIPRRQDAPLEVPKLSLKGDTRTFESYKDLYRRAFWMSEIDKKDIATINSMLDPDVLEYLNYSTELV